MDVERRPLPSYCDVAYETLRRNKTTDSPSSDLSGRVARGFTEFFQTQICVCTYEIVPTESLDTLFALLGKPVYPVVRTGAHPRSVVG